MIGVLITHTANEAHIVKQPSNDPYYVLEQQPFISVG